MSTETKNFFKAIAFVMLPVFVLACIFQVTILKAYADANGLKQASKPYNVTHVVERSPAVVYMKGKRP